MFRAILKKKRSIMGPYENSALYRYHGGFHYDSVIEHSLVGPQPPLLTTQDTSLLSGELNLQGLCRDCGSQTQGVLWRPIGPIVTPKNKVVMVPLGEGNMCVYTYVNVSVCVSVCDGGGPSRQHIKRHCLPFWHFLMWLFLELLVHPVAQVMLSLY